VIRRGDSTRLHSTPFLDCLSGKLLLAPVSRVFLGSESTETHDHILVSDVSQSRETRSVDGCLAIVASILYSIPAFGHVTIFWCGYMKRSKVCYIKGNGLRLNICMCYSRAIGLRVDLDISSNYMQDWKGIREKAKEVNFTKAFLRIMRLPVDVFNWCFNKYSLILLI
jgi:hypothetical protein